MKLKHETVTVSGCNVNKKAFCTAWCHFCTRFRLWT